MRACIEHAIKFLARRGLVAGKPVRHAGGDGDSLYFAGAIDGARVGLVFDGSKRLGEISWRGAQGLHEVWYLRRGNRGLREFVRRVSESRYVVAPPSAGGQP